MPKPLCDTCRHHRFGLVQEQSPSGEVQLLRADLVFTEDRDVIIARFRESGIVENLSVDAGSVGSEVYRIIELGECRIRSPNGDRFPARLAYDWCGEHAPRPSGREDEPYSG